MENPRFDITIAGEVNLDLILYGIPEQMPTERELLGSRFEMTLGGSSAIVAHNLAILGSRVGFISRVGKDEFGRISLQRLAESGADLSKTLYDEQLGTGVTMLLPHGEHRHILTYAGSMAEMRVADLDLGYLCSARHFHLSSLFLQKGLQPELSWLFRELKQAGLTLSLDTNDDPDDCWAGVLEELLDLVDILLPNERELLRIARQPTVELALAALAPRVPLIVVKCGSRGAVVQEGERREHFAPVFVQPVDTIGAGDSFDAGFLHAWLRGGSTRQCVEAGNVAGALSTLRAGGTEAFRDPALLNEFRQRHPQLSLIADSR